MEVEINMINVEDGDAIILTLKKTTGAKALIIIDGGFKKFFNTRLKKRLDELLPEFNNKISLIVCTHYDDDHLSGVECLIDEYHQIIDKIWMHKAQGTLSDKIIELNQNIEQVEKNYHTLLLEQINPISARLKIVLEDYKHLVKVLKKIKDKGLEDKIVEAIEGEKLQGFHELEVISPTANFYNQNLDAIKNDQLIQEHYNNMDDRYFFKEDLNLSDPQLLIEWRKLMNACDYLETSSLANNVTATNMISIVILLSANDKKYLFTGDAGIETFEYYIPKWKERLSKLDWLDLPHHGSKNNTSKNMIDVFSPKIVFISASGKDNRPSQYLKTCLFYRDSNINITNSAKDTWYLKLNTAGEVEIIKDEL